jgi:hypothetical protein
LPFGLAQNEIGNAALRVGGTMLSGIKSAYEAAKNKATTSPISPNRLVSKSAPTDERLFLAASTTLDDKNKDKDKVVVTPHTSPVHYESGFYVTVLDLQPLLQGASNKPLKVAEFVTSKSQPIAHLAFSKDGCKLICVPENGQVTRVFALYPRPVEEGRDAKAGDGLRLYNLRRGRTSVLVEGLESSTDGRWIAIGTKHRTVHVFPTNPFGGRPDIPGHLHGKVCNVDELVSFFLVLSTFIV